MQSLFIRLRLSVLYSVPFLFQQHPYLCERVCSSFSDAGKFCLAPGLRELTRDTKSDVSYLQTFFTHRNEKRRMTFGMVVIKRNLDILFKASIVPIIGKKNDQSSVSEADREIPTRESQRIIMPETR